MQYLQTIYSQVTCWPNARMDKYEQRRAALRNLVDSLGRGGIATVAASIGKVPNYVSRMLYEPGKSGRKRIGEDSWDELVAAYPQLCPSVPPAPAPAPALSPAWITTSPAHAALAQTLDSLGARLSAPAAAALARLLRELARNGPTTPDDLTHQGFKGKARRDHPAPSD